MIDLMAERTPLTDALTAIQAADERVGYWAQQLLEAKNARTAAETWTDLDALADPSDVDRLSTELATAQARVPIVGHAYEAALQDARVPRVSALLAEADELEPAALEAEQALVTFDAKTARLKAALEKHTGQPYAVVKQEWTDDPRPAPKQWTLRTAAEDARRPVVILRAVAEGRNPIEAVGQEMYGHLRPHMRPNLTADQYPASVWGPDALIPAPAWTAKDAGHRRELDEVRAEHERMGQTLEGLRAKLSRLNPRASYNLPEIAALEKSIADLEGALERFESQHAAELRAQGRLS